MKPPNDENLRRKAVVLGAFEPEHNWVIERWLLAAKRHRLAAAVTFRPGALDDLEHPCAHPAISDALHRAGELGALLWLCDVDDFPSFTDVLAIATVAQASGITVRVGEEAQPLANHFDELGLDLAALIAGRLPSQVADIIAAAGAPPLIAEVTEYLRAG